jgi:hypothetical protein
MLKGFTQATPRTTLEKVELWDGSNHIRPNIVPQGMVCEVRLSLWLVYLRVQSDHFFLLWLVLGTLKIVLSTISAGMDDISSI